MAKLRQYQTIHKADIVFDDDLSTETLPSSPLTEASTSSTSTMIEKQSLQGGI